jgi:hypothetical protein
MQKTFRGDGRILPLVNAAWLSAMLDFLSQFNHFPGRRKNSFVSLFLPKLDIEPVVRILSND